MKKIELYIVTARHKLTNDLLFNVGVFSNYDYTVNLVETLRSTKNPAIGEIHYGLEPFILDRVEDTILKQHPDYSAPAYVYDEIVKVVKGNDVKRAVDSIIDASIHKILKEIEDCLDNPEVVKEYIQGVRDHVEDYL